MADRRALLIGHWGAEAAPGPTRQRVRGFVTRLEKALSPDGRYPFHSLRSRLEPTAALFNPTRASLTELIADQAQGITGETVLLLYYLGHSRAKGENDLELTLRYDKSSDRYTYITVSSLLRDIKDAGIRNLILVLDSCHSGRCVDVVAEFPNYFAMFATGSNYAFNANFTEEILDTIEALPRARDQRISRRHKGFTYNKLFEISRGALLAHSEQREDYKQEPSCAGGLGDMLLAEAPPRIGKEYNRYAGRRTIYGRIYTVLMQLSQGRQSTQSLLAALAANPAFLLSLDEATGERRPLKTERLLTYLNFMQRVGFAEHGENQWSLTDLGQKALAEDRYNTELIAAIDRELLGSAVKLEDIDWAANELLVDQIPPSAKNIADRLLQKRKILILDDTVKLGLQALTMTGRFMKSSADALFPSERTL